MYEENTLVLASESKPLLKNKNPRRLRLIVARVNSLRIPCSFESNFHGRDDSLQGSFDSWNGVELNSELIVSGKEEIVAF